MATLDKDLLNEWLSTMVRVFVGAGMTPADFAAAVVADVGDATDAAAVLAALDAHIADAANAHAASAIGSTGAVPVESGAFTTEPLEKYIALDEAQVVRWRKGDNTYSTLITSQGNEVIIGCATSDAAGASLYKTFRFNIDSGRVYASSLDITSGSGVLQDVTGTFNINSTGGMNIVTNAYGSPIVIHGSNVNLDSGGNLTLAGIAVPTNNVQATASPTAAENTAAGYPNGALWTEVDASKLWVKVSESAGTAVWLSTTLA